MFLFLFACLSKPIPLLDPLMDIAPYRSKIDWAEAGGSFIYTTGYNSCFLARRMQMQHMQVKQSMSPTPTVVA